MRDHGLWKRLFASFVREWRTVTMDRTLFVVVLVAPLFYGVFYSTVYLNKGEQELPVAIVDHDRTSGSRALVRSLDAHLMIHATGMADLGSAQVALRSGQVFGVLYIPNGFQRALKRGQGTDLKTWVSSDRFLIANDVNRAFSEVTATVGAGIRMKAYRSKGMSGAQAISTAEPIRADVRSLFNPSDTYGDFMIPGLLALVLQQILLIGIGVSMAHHRETHAALPDLYETAGKAWFFLVLFSAYSAIYFNGYLRLFNLEIRGSAVAFIALQGLLLPAIVAMGVLAGSFFKRAVAPLQLLVLTSYPFFLMSGYSWPSASMPGVVRGMAALLPVAPYMQAFTHIVQMGADLNQIRPELAHLGLLTVAYGTAAGLRIYFAGAKPTGALKHVTRAV